MLDRGQDGTTAQRCRSRLMGRTRQPPGLGHHVHPLPGPQQRKDSTFRVPSAEELLPSRARNRVARAKKAVVRKPSISLRSRVTKATQHIPSACNQMARRPRWSGDSRVVSPSCGRGRPLEGLGSGLALSAGGKPAWEAALRDRGRTPNHPSRRRLDTMGGVVYRSASRSAGECRREAHLSAAQQEPQAHPRVSCPHEDSRRPRRHASPPGQGAPAPHGNHREEVT